MGGIVSSAFTGIWNFFLDYQTETTVESEKNDVRKEGVKKRKREGGKKEGKKTSSKEESNKCDHYTFMKKIH